jgi:hypothetical protein
MDLMHIIQCNVKNQGFGYGSCTIFLKELRKCLLSSQNFVYLHGLANYFQ